MNCANQPRIAAHLTPRPPPERTGVGDMQTAAPAKCALTLSSLALLTCALCGCGFDNGNKQSSGGSGSGGATAGLSSINHIIFICAGESFVRSLFRSAAPILGAERLSRSIVRWAAAVQPGVGSCAARRSGSDDSWLRPEPATAGRLRFRHQQSRHFVPPCHPMCIENPSPSWNEGHSIGTTTIPRVKALRR